MPLSPFYSVIDYGLIRGKYITSYCLVEATSCGFVACPGRNRTPGEAVGSLSRFGYVRTALIELGYIRYQQKPHYGA